MKANRAKINAEKEWQSVMLTMQDNLLLVLDVLHTDYGFGKQRINAILKKVATRAAQFDQWQADEVLDLKTAEIREQTVDETVLRDLLRVRMKGCLPNWFYEQVFGAVPSNHEMRQKYKRNTSAQQVNISVAEAAKAVESLQAMKEYLEHCGGGTDESKGIFTAGLPH